MKIGACLLIIFGCMPYLIHYGDAVLPYGGVGGYGYGLGGVGGGNGGNGGAFSPLLLLFALPLLFGFGGGAGGTDTVIVSEDSRTRLTNLLIRRSTLTGAALAAYTEKVTFCSAANKDQTGCGNLGATCTYLATVGLCIPA